MVGLSLSTAAFRTARWAKLPFDRVLGHAAGDAV